MAIHQWQWESWCTFIVQVSWVIVSSWCSSVTWKMVLKRLFMGDTGEDCTLQIHSSGLLGDRAIHQYKSFTQKVVLKRQFLGDTGEDSALWIGGVLLMRWFWMAFLQWVKLVKKLCMFIYQVFQDMEIFESIRVLLSWNGSSFVTLGNILHVYVEVSFSW